MVSALAVVLCSSCDQQAERQLQTSVLGNYCEVTVLAYADDAVHAGAYGYDYYSNVVISYEGGSGTNFGTYMVPQQGDVTVSWTYDADYDCSETFNVGSAVKMTIVVRGSSAFANY